MEIHSRNIGNEIKRWFQKSILDDNIIDYADIEVFESALQIFIFDYQRYYPNSATVELTKLVVRHELVAILLYRIARVYFENKKENIALLYSSLATFLSGFEIYYSSTIGKGLKINHGIGTVIGARTIIGENALIHQGVTLGDKDGGRPTLENNVTVYAGAKIVGAITIGNNSIVAANCVCFIDVPDNKTAVGVPAKIIN